MTTIPARAPDPVAEHGRGQVPDPASGPVQSIERWNTHHRLQHLTLALAMIGLLGTGLPIKYAYTAWGPVVIRLLGGFQATLVIHKVSAVLISLTAVGHLVFLIWGRRRYGPSQAMLPDRQDLRDARHHGAFLLGLRDDPPNYGRYSYLEKFEYLAIFWGMVVMGLSGFALWFPVRFGAVIPRWGLDVLRIVHSNEAFVALLSLAFGHFFTAHFSPLVFPSSPVWYSGRISLAHLYQEHRREFEHLVAQGHIPAAAARLAAHPHGLRLSGWRRAVGVLELLLYSAVFYWLLITFIPLLLG